MKESFKKKARKQISAFLYFLKHFESQPDLNPSLRICVVLFHEFFGGEFSKAQLIKGLRLPRPRV